MRHQHSDRRHAREGEQASMSGWLSYITGSGGKSRDSPKDAIVNLRQHLLMLDKKEEHLQKKIDDEQRKAKANATTNKRGHSCPYL